MTASEFDLIEKYFKPLAPSDAPAFSLSNDGAIHTPILGKNIIYTVDTLVAGVHFFENDKPEFIAKKALRVNLSDLAAMAAQPLGYLVSIAISDNLINIEDWIMKFTQGLAEDQAHYGIRLWGGDTVSTPGPVTISITAIGEIDENINISRSGAKVGDHIYVSGTLGDAAAGLIVIKEELDPVVNNFLINRYNLPVPRLKVAKKISSSVTSMMDISDGLVGDLKHICRHSGVGAIIESQKLPISAEFSNLLETKKEYSELCWSGGDDYELLFTANEKSDHHINEVSKQCGIKLTKIGKITDGHDVILLDDDGAVINTVGKGFRHFKD